MCTGSYFSKYCQITTNLQTRAHTALNQFFSGEILEEPIPGQVTAAVKPVHHGPIIHGGYCKNLDLYKIQDLGDLEVVFSSHCRAFKRTLQEESDSGAFFRSYRSILDMEHLSDRHNTYVFWKTYIKQLWEQADQDEKVKIWTLLNDLTNFSRKLDLPQ